MAHKQFYSGTDVAFSLFPDHHPNLALSYFFFARKRSSDELRHSSSHLWCNAYDHIKLAFFLTYEISAKFQPIKFTTDQMSISKCIDHYSPSNQYSLFSPYLVFQ